MNRPLFYSKAQRLRMTRLMLWIVLALTLVLGACRPSKTSVTSTPAASQAPEVTAGVQASPTPTASQPTATPEPLAARVNGEPITLAE